MMTVTEKNCWFYAVFVNSNEPINTPANKLLAETARFELAVAITRHDGLANRWFQPLTHVSGLMARRGYSGALRWDQPGSLVAIFRLKRRPAAQSTRLGARAIAGRVLKASNRISCYPAVIRRFYAQVFFCADRRARFDFALRHNAAARF
jgi:hypothetical protein